MLYTARNVTTGIAHPKRFAGGHGAIIGNTVKHDIRLTVGAHVAGDTVRPGREVQSLSRDAMNTESLG